MRSHALWRPKTRMSREVLFRTRSSNKFCSHSAGRPSACQLYIDPGKTHTLPTSHRSKWTIILGQLTKTDSTIAPPPNQRFSLTNVLLLLETRKVAMKRTSSHIFLFAKGYRPMMWGWQGALYFGRYGRRLV